MIDVIIISATLNDIIKEMTQNAINTCGGNVYIVETHDKDVKYSNCKMLYFIKDNFSYNKAVNFGISKTKSEYVGFFNNDVIFHDGWITEIIGQMKKYNVFSASPFCKLSHQKTSEEVVKGYEVRKHIAGWGIVVNREVLKQIGKINEDVDFWRSDYVYAEQLKQNNIEHMLCCNSFVTHMDGGSKTLSISKNKKELTLGQYNKKVNIDYKYKFSIVIACTCQLYGNCAGESVEERKELLKRALKSIFKQTYKDYEIILVSDGCDDTVEVFQELHRDGFKCLKIDKQKTWSGQVRQAGINHAVGEYIIYLDSDDYWGKNHLKNIESQLDDEDWVYMNENVWNGQEFKRKDVILQISRSGTSSICHKRKLNVSWLGKNDYAHDWLFIKELMMYKNYKKIKKGEYYIMHLA